MRGLGARVLAALRACGLGPRLLTGFLLVALLPTIAMCGIAYVGARDEILMAEERSSLRMAQYLRSELSSLLSSYPAKLNTIASDMAVIRLIRSYRKADAVEAKSLQYALMSRLISEAASLRGFMSVEIVTDTGTPISKLPYSIMNESLFARIEGANEKFAFWVGRYRWGDLYPEASLSQRDRTVVLAARRILDYANVKLLGYIVISFDCTELESLLPSDAGAQIMISDEQGAVLAGVGDTQENLALLAQTLSRQALPEELESRTMNHKDDSNLVITGQIAASPYRLTLSIAYRQIFSGLTRMFTVIISAAVFIALMMLGIAWLLTRSVTVPVTRLSGAMRRFGAGEFEARIGDAAHDEIGMLCREFDDMAGRVCRLTEQLCEARAKEKEAVYTALQAQINPHFLYNTLDMISWMGYGASNADICKVVASLSDFFRLSLNKGEDSFTLADELNHVKSYITIQEYRMRHIQFRLEAPRELLNLRVPKLMVQPLVENAILHGLRPRNYRGHITISCALEQAYLVIRVMDDGVGFDEKLLGERTEKSTSYGLKNIRQRLAVLYDDRGSLEIANRPEGGVVARLRYPAEKGAPAGGKGGAE
ncbi:MAG TPA: sensor histidine kinase [Candidatus Limiplasma merdipullorum]|nr:sensor histidine kinase [Candidatus Limiplasma merdipullorum]